MTFRKVLVFLTFKDLRIKVIRNIDQKKALLLHTTVINVRGLILSKVER